MLFWEGREILEILLAQKRILPEGIERNEHCIPSKSGERLIWGVGITRWPHREYLPEFL